MPVVVCPPADTSGGKWRVEGDGRDLTGIHENANGEKTGFALSGKAVSRKQELEKEMPSLLR